MKKNNGITKALSVLLTAVMLLSMVSLGIIVPDAKIEAQAVTVSSVATLNSAITTANSNPSVQTTIQLSAAISVGETAALTTITGNVLFDFNGYNLIFSYTGSCSGGNDNSEYQLPSENQGTNNRTDEYLTKAMFNVGTAGKLKIINSSATDAMMQVNTYLTRDASNGSSGKTYTASSNLIYSEGTLTLGDRSNSSYNNFTLQSQAVVYCKTKGLDYRNNNAYTVADAVTVNNANARFFMYGGTVNVAATSRGKYNGKLYSRCYGINIVSAYSAEIYNGSANVLPDNECGFRNSDSTDSDGDKGYWAAVRVCSPNTYIFNLTSAVKINLGSDTGDAVGYSANIFVPDAANAPYVYGCAFINSSERSDSGVATLNAYNIMGAYKIASGTITPSTAFGTNNPASPATGTSNTLTLNSFTKMYFGDANTNNGVYPWAYATFREYVNAHTAENDAYYTNSSTHHGDGENQNLDTENKYRRNIYTQDGWYCSYNVANETGSDTPQASGTLFCYPKWKETVYYITYDLNNGTGAFSAVQAAGAPSSYTISSTSQFPLPTRTGYDFVRWEITGLTYADGENPGLLSQGNLWYVGNRYNAGTSVNGHIGNIALKAIWSEISYTVTFDNNNTNPTAGGTTPVSTKTTATYNVNSTFTFPTGITRDFYTFNNTWSVSTASGNWTLGNTYNAGSTTSTGMYGTPTFKANYTPITYTASYNSQNGSTIDDNSFKTYTYECTKTLPVSTRTGYTFLGWKPIQSVGSWNSSVTYPAGTAFKFNNGNVSFDAQWESSVYTLILDLSSCVPSSSTTLSYSYASSLEPNSPSKTGYTFAGWRVKSATAVAGEPCTWVVGDVYTPDPVTGKVTIPAQKQGNVTLEPVWTVINYTVTYNTNGGNLIAAFTYNIESTFNLPLPSRNGYTFVSWTDNISGAGENWNSASYAAGTQITGMYGDVVLTAGWTETPYTVTLNANGGTVATSSLTYDINSQLALPVPEKTGYTFTGWKITAAAAVSNWTVAEVYTDSLETGHYGNVTLTAQWTHTAYTLHFTSAGTVPQDITYYIDSASFTLPSSSNPGYSFVDWSVKTSIGTWTMGSKYTTSSPVVNKWGNVTLDAEFTPINYLITYAYPNGTEDTESYNIEDTVTVNDYSLNGYTFGGWRVAETDGGWRVGAVIQPGQLESGVYYGNVTLEPILSATNYSVNFIPNGGTPYVNLNYNIESTDVLPSPERTGYNFAGWKVTTSAGNWNYNESYAAGTAVTGKYGSVSLTAQWTPKLYDITWNVGDAPVVTQAAYNSVPTPPSNTAKSPDAQYYYTFREWSPAISTVTGEASYTALYDTELRSYTITWVVETDEFGGVERTNTTWNYGETPVYNNAVNPVKATSDENDHFWRFNGWDVAISAVTGNKTYTAQFIEVSAPRTVVWVVNGVENTEKWGIGETPVYEGAVNKADENGYSFTFDRWSPAVVAVEDDVDYRYEAIFTSSPRTYTVNYDVNAGEMSEPASAQFTTGTSINLPLPVRYGYSFSGWLLTSSTGTWSSLVTGGVAASGSFAATGLWGNASFKAIWTPVNYTIHFDVADGTAPEDLSYTIESTATIPNAEREGHVLNGWVVSVSDGSWGQGSIISQGASVNGCYGNVTLQPMWSAKTYEIHWVSDGEVITSETTYGSPVVAYEPVSKMGYNAAWDEEVPSTMPATDLTFTAVYTPIDYFVRVNTNGGSAIENFYYNIESTGVLPTPTRSGATFNGWLVTIANGNWVKNVTVAAGTSLSNKYGNISITAQWLFETHTVTWVAGDVTRESVWYYGAVPSYDGTPYKSSDSVNSYVFAGWDKEIVTVTQDVVYTALFNPVERRYTVTWYVDGAEITQNYGYNDIPVYPGTTPQRPSTEAFVYAFTGWSPSISAVTADVMYIAEFSVFTKVTSLSLSSSCEFLEKGDSYTLNATVSPSNATVADVIWSSSNNNIATVSAAGQITAVGSGIAVICAESADGDFKAYSVVTVAAEKVKNVLVSAGGVSTVNYPGQTLALTAVVSPVIEGLTGVIWRSSNSNVASVDANGVVTYNRIGTATIYATSVDGCAIGTIDVECIQNPEIVDDEEKTKYVLMFSATDDEFIINGKSYSELSLQVTEGDTVSFKVSGESNVLLNGVKTAPDADGVYTIENITKNYSITAVGNSNIGLEEDDETPQTFLQKLQAFFRKIVLFFRGLFG